MISSMSKIVLETKLVGSIDGDFMVKSYQRGYRWGREEILRLLDDIYLSKGKNYCLQPIVVKKDDNNHYELIDGQQRLTTIYLIYQVMHHKSNGFLNNPKFTIDYETRKNSKEYLADIDISKKEENIDFYYMAQAYETIYHWFDNKDSSVMTKLNEYLYDSVKVIWYEVDESMDSIALFTRLNIGKIPLTSAELVKAMFLSKDLNEKLTKEKQEEIALQWDHIEKELHDQKLWYFLTNKSTEEYQTRMDLILDLVSNKEENSKEKYYTFFKIDEMKKEKSLSDIWKEIQKSFLELKDWYENHERYHKIGYLITANIISIRELFHLSKGKEKDEFIKELDRLIKESLKIDKNYGELEYGKDNEILFRLLLLFNIESVRKNGEHTQWFPFDKFKYSEDGKNVWSLEHIHAQQSDNMKTVDVWQEWLSLHLESILDIAPNQKELIQEIEEVIHTGKIDSIEFQKLQEKIMKLLSEKEVANFMHSIGNLALLNSADNSALSNSTFDVKRNKVIKMDKMGIYIPFCTRMVFLKYYSKSQNNNLHFWGKEDMNAYVEHMNYILADYLEGNIDLIGSEKND